MRIQKALAIATAIVCVVVIAPWVITFGGQALSPKPGDWGVFGDYIGGTLSGPLALAGFIALLITIQQQRSFALAEQNKSNDLRYFESALQCLKRAYETIKPIEAEAPPKSRLVWLTTARWLLAANSISSKISGTSPSLKNAYELEAEHYRMLFCNFLKPNQMDSVFSQQAFFAGDRSMSGSELEERSVRVILEFMEWPEEKRDVIDKVPVYTREEVESMHVWLRGLQAFLQGKPRFKQ
ncbi:hypothetical protein BJN45_13495 [Azonexus hydrophilus]|uniref:Uncharacterized protein n=1 Tax=Azonexus hydrophilus TaxID=418702 RepID=A0A1R1I3C2_9RHOO|nr:hypothetical protein [Azonexus hydrophilus]OMG53225.1 hypothetical protein BJN45_13495 [Azonexus hydrophilus]